MAMPLEVQLFLSALHQLLEVLLLLFQLLDLGGELVHHGGLARHKTESQL